MDGGLATDAAGVVLRHVPPGPERDELLALVRLGLAFRSQQRGRRPGFLRRYVAELVARIGGRVTFQALLDELESEAARRALHGELESPVELVNRAWELVTIHDPVKGRREVAFKTIRNALTAASVPMKSDFPE